MHRRSFWIFVVAATISGGSARAADGEGEYRLSGPLASGNLAVYFVHGKSSDGPVPLTLQEAMANDARAVKEGRQSSLRYYPSPRS